MELAANGELFSALGREDQQSKSEDHFGTLQYQEIYRFGELVARVLGVSPSSGHELIHENGFPVLRVGSRMVMPKDAFIRWAESHTGGGG